MAIQYTMPIMAYDNIEWRVNIYSDSYSGQPTTIKGSMGQSAMLSYSGETDDHFGVFISSTLTVNCINEGNINADQLQNAQDRQYRIEVQRQNVLYWVGYMLSEDIEQPMSSAAYVMKITAICGLTMLEDMDYIHNNLPGVNGSGSRCPMNFIRQILFATQNLNVQIPIRWTNNLRNAVYEGQDVFIGDVEWSPRGEGFNQVDVNTGISLPKKNQYILEGILKSMQCRIYQAFGRWNIRRIPDYFSGVAKYSQIPGNLGVIRYNQSSEVIAKKIGSGGYPFINNRDLLTNVAGIKSCKVTYNADVRENIIPNGNQDLTSLAFPIYWGFFDPNSASAISNPGSLDGRSGYSTDLVNLSSQTKYFTLLSNGAELTTNGLPIDSKRLVKVVNFSFYFSPKKGFPITGVVKGVLKIVEIISDGAIRPDGVYNNVAISTVTGSGSGARVNMVVSGGVVTSIVVSSGGSGYAEGDSLQIPSSSPSDPLILKASPIIDFSNNPLQLKIVMNIGVKQYFLNEFGFWVTDCRSIISPSVEALKIDDIARIAFDKFQGVKLPEPDFNVKPGDTCDIKIIFLVKPGQEYFIDNISITIDNSNDVFVCTQNDSKNTKEDTIDLNISSSFGGYMVSNFMTNWDKSDTESEFIDGDKYRGTLTGVMADSVMRCKYAPSKIYNGSINVRNKNWSFDEIYTIETLADRRFMPINANYNIEKCEVDLVAIETRNDDISRTMKQYGSNDQQLSN